MIVRIDTTFISRGQEFSLYGRNPSGKPVLIRAIEIATGNVEQLQFSHSVSGEMDVYSTTAPAIDGYLMASVGSQKVTKKIGNPIPSFVIGYRDGYTVGYEEISASGEVINSGSLNDAGEGWYWTTLSQGTAIVKALGRRFIVNKNLLKMNYEITMEGGTLGSDYQSAGLNDIGLPDMALDDVGLEDATLDSTMPTVTIKEL